MPETHWHCVFCGKGVYLGRDSVRKQDFSQTYDVPRSVFQYAHGACVVNSAGWTSQTPSAHG